MPKRKEQRAESKRANSKRQRADDIGLSVVLSSCSPYVDAHRSLRHRRDHKIAAISRLLRCLLSYLRPGNAWKQSAAADVEVRGQRSEVRGQRSETRGQKAEGRRQEGKKAEGKKAEGKKAEQDNRLLTTDNRTTSAPTEVTISSVRQLDGFKPSSFKIGTVY
jgi:hypothetical protein